MLDTEAKKQYSQKLSCVGLSLSDDPYSAKTVEDSRQIWPAGLGWSTDTFYSVITKQDGHIDPNMPGRQWLGSIDMQ